MRFQAPQLGALGVTFTSLRLLQFLALITIVGLTAYFIDEIIGYQQAAPEVLIGTISVASIATLYTAISYILYYDGLLPLLVAGGMDFAMLIAAIVVAATIGKPLGPLTCGVLPVPKDDEEHNMTVMFTGELPGTNSMVRRTNAYQAAVSNSERPTANYLSFVAIDQPHCYQVKTVWGLSIAVCIFFAFTSIVCVGLWRRTKTTTDAPKDIEG